MERDKCLERKYKDDQTLEKRYNESEYSEGARPQIALLFDFELPALCGIPLGAKHEEIVPSLVSLDHFYTFNTDIDATVKYYLPETSCQKNNAGYIKEVHVVLNCICTYEFEIIREAILEANPLSRKEMIEYAKINSYEESEEVLIRASGHYTFLLYDLDIETYEHENTTSLTLCMEAKDEPMLAEMVKLVKKKVMDRFPNRFWMLPQPY